MSKKDKTAYGDKFVGQEPTRVESLSIKLKFNAARYLPVADRIADICGWKSSLVAVPGDTINFNYLLEAAYFGKVEERLNQVVTLLTYLDSDVVVAVDGNLLDATSCLLVRVADKLREVKTIADARERTWIQRAASKMLEVFYWLRR